MLFASHTRFLSAMTISQKLLVDMQPRSWCWLRERIDHGQWLSKRIFHWGWFGDPQHLMLFFRHFDRLRTSWAQKKPKVMIDSDAFQWASQGWEIIHHLNCYENIGGGMVAPSHPLHPSLPTCKRPAQNFCSQVDSSSVASIDIGVFRRLNESVVYKERHGIPMTTGY